MMLRYLINALDALRQTPASVVDDTYNSPGTVGFIATFLVAVGVVLLFLDMTRRVRRTRYREEVRSRLESPDSQDQT